MLARDDELRLSAAVQAEYAACGDDSALKAQVTNKVQRQVAVEHGFQDNVAEGVDLMRSATYLFPNDHDVLQAAHYLRNNIHTPCPFSVGQKVPLDLPLHQFQLPGRTVRPDHLAAGLSLAPVTLGEVLAASAPRPTLIAAGSHT